MSTPGPASAETPERICVGRILGPHGVRGLLTVRSHTADPGDVAAYGPVETASGRKLVLEVRGAKKAGLVVAANGVDTREAAEALKGQDLFAPRAALPEPDADEWYHADLVGLAAVNPQGEPLGRIVAVENFGAGDLLEVALPAGPTVYVPFTADIVPDVDVRAGRVVLDPPAGLFDEAPGEVREEAGEEQPEEPGR